jgi:hypothetical protein
MRARSTYCRWLRSATIASNTVRAGGTPAGVAPGYYDLYCALQLLPRGADCAKSSRRHRTRENIADGVRVQAISRSDNPQRSRLQCRASVNCDLSPCDVTAFIGQQEQNQGRDLFGRSHAFHRDQL